MSGHWLPPIIRAAIKVKPAPRIRQVPPMNNERRRQVYGRAVLTPRQRRRIRKHENRSSTP